MVTYNHQALADAVIEAIITSPLLVVGVELLGEDFAALPGVDWLESCHSERRELLTRLQLIRAAEEHIKATLDIDAQQAAEILRTALKERKPTEAARQVATEQIAPVSSVNIGERDSSVLPPPSVSAARAHEPDRNSRPGRFSILAELRLASDSVAEPMPRSRRQSH